MRIALRKTPPRKSEGRGAEAAREEVEAEAKDEAGCRGVRGRGEGAGCAEAKRCPCKRARRPQPPAGCLVLVQHLSHLSLRLRAACMLPSEAAGLARHV